MQSENPTAAILLIGDEILSGRTREANAYHLAGELTVRALRSAVSRALSTTGS